MIFTVMISIMCFFYFEPTLTINLEDIGMKPKNTSLGFAAIALTFSISCPVSGFLATKINRKIVINFSLLLISISVFLIGPSELFNLPDTLPIIFTGLFLVGFGSGGVLAPSIPEIVESTIEKIKLDREDAFNQRYTTDELKNIREVVSDKGSAL